MPRITIAVATLRTLPRTEELIVGEDQIDIMGHMNTMHYWEMFSLASRALTSLTGVTAGYVQQARRGAFMLKNFTQFIAEAHHGDHLVVYSRLIARSDKRYQYMHFMVNESTDRLAATMEALSTHADLDARRSTPFAPDIAARIDAIIAEHDRIDWQDAPLCGVLSP